MGHERKLSIHSYATSDKDVPFEKWQLCVTIAWFAADACVAP